MAKLVVSEAGLGRSKELVQSAKTGLQDFQKKAKFAAEFETAKATLAEKPDDAAAHVTVGMYYAFIQNKWAKALPHLAKGNDEALQTLARQESGSSTRGIEKQVALADAWWDAAQNAEGLRRTAMLRRAGFWYSKAASGDISGLDEGQGRKAAGRTWPRPSTKARPSVRSRVVRFSSTSGSRC